ncbi:MAG: NifB/NifX family molybdenum-iron cluster-binding protein [Campylobacterales bacterium]|nr:NifB/NifX family molybdenum-iron cluster-binding protein [Campylobacterales bacterium]
MTVIPVKTDVDQSAIAPLFGKAKWFALISDEGVCTFWRNDTGGGRDVVTQLQRQGVTRVIFTQMGANPYMLLQRAGIKVYHAGEGRILFQESLAKLNEGGLTEVTPLNMSEYLEKGHKHSNGEHHHHDHGHEHHHEHGAHHHEHLYEHH